ncbi:hypothetical protein ACFFQW_39475 [Umezawaea endophytica]|uniref:Lipoprotein n=1 Tax=Umezawaea endophytica TaxID=1654476 RepID=A0A9X3AG23_9PSEU|nr:hypothetical protein [Umezawaea endophytica]MCS7479522.1 hypothetical protein [Umezawaea endophytica]
MTWLIRFALCLPLLVAGCGSSEGGGAATSAAPDDTGAVHKAFETYTKAALAKDGATAQGVLADTVSKYYDDARKLALTATDDQLTGISSTQRLTVYVLRAEVEPALLRDGSPADLLRTSFDKGLVGEAGIAELALGKVNVTGDKASAQAVVGGEAAPYTVDFIREQGVWKVDIAPLMTLADEGFAEAAKQQGTTVNAMIDGVLVTKYGPEKAAALHQPVAG